VASGAHSQHHQGPRSTAGGNRLAQSAAMGAQSLVYAATAAEVRGGDYIAPTGFIARRAPFIARGAPGVARSSARSHDPALARRLWQISEELTGVQYAGLAQAAALP
jgi:hypothetical protein